MFLKMSLRFFLALPTLFIMAGLISSCKNGENDPEISKDEQIYINELYASEGDDWIELYNASDETKDISGYKIYDDLTNKYVLPGNTVITPRSYLVLICDDSGSGLFTNFKLSSLGETVYLENVAGNVIDKIDFPALDNGQSYGRFPDGSSNLKISGSNTKGESNGETIGIIINSILRTPLVPALNEAVAVEVEILNTSEVSTVKLYYRIDGGTFNSVGMNNSNTVYSGIVPALNTTATVDYFVEVINKAGIASKIPHDAPDDFYTYLLNNDPLPSLKINEFMAVNVSCCPDVDGGVQEFDDWIEIYNAGPAPVNLADFYLSDDLENPFNSRIKRTNSAKTTIQPGGFLAIWADNNRSQGELHLDFGLSADGEAIGLFYKDGRKIDSYTFGAQTANRSMGLTSDGGATWQTFTSPTPGQSND
jgi:hypothetical protein